MRESALVCVIYDFVILNKNKKCDIKRMGFIGKYRFIVQDHISYHIISYHEFCIISYHTEYHKIYHIISYHIISYHIISYHIISCISHHIISYHIILYSIFISIYIIHIIYYTS